ncbi:MAG: hypothetical protein KAR23_03790, partial [Candidatus Aenigmarchaeota archaeon]|nr:hypothetical protein [Candidatus Aenigmarchaeota archaeon]
NIFFHAKTISCDTELVQVKGKEQKIHQLNKTGIPIVAIAGTHERRGKDMTNPVNLLNTTGYLIGLHSETAIYRKDKETVAITGISGVPEAFAREVFKKIDPRPEDGCINIMLMHQSVGKYVYTDERSPGLDIEDLPEGFDLIVNGHIHWRNDCMIGPKKDTLFLIPGSTLTTQVRANEAGKDKGVTIYDTKTKKTEFIPLKTQRKVIYKEIECDKKSIREIKENVIEYLSEISKEIYTKKPVVRIKITGKIDSNNSRIDLSDIIAKNRDRYILSFKNNLKNDKQDKSMKLLSELIDNRLSIDSMGLEIMKDYAGKAKISFDYRQIFELLADGRVEDAEDMLLKLPKDKKNSQS